MSQYTYLTEEGLKRLKEELTQLKSVERGKISAQIAEARDKGDLSENAEYDAAKEAQGLLELKIGKMENLLANARLVDETNMDTSQVFILSKVKVLNKTFKKEIIYTLVAENEADLKAAKISVDSPIGRGLLGKKVGDVISIPVPSGMMEMEVLEITR
jgi:transcription elongation factor GreA